jgi:hypothetical protein
MPLMQVQVSVRALVLVLEEASPPKERA